jgi:hypothetical protein
VLLVHHVRKGTVTDIDSARGAKALTDSGRVGLIMVGMTPEEAEQFGVPPDDAWMHVRIADAKRNLAPAAKAKWLKLDQVKLGNETPDYPSGDSVAAIIAWEPPNVWALHSGRDINRCLDIIAAGLPNGALFSLSRRGGSDRWSGRVLTQQLGVTDGQAGTMLNTWARNGLLVEETYRDRGEGKDRKGVVVIDSKRPGRDGEHE